MSDVTAPGEKVLIRRDGAVLVITINRPQVRNAIDLETSDKVGAALADLDRDDDLRVAVITGAGPMFCAGMDLKAFLRGEIPPLPDPRMAWYTTGPPAKPFIAAIEGAALGGGFEIALACDLIVAGRSARFALPEVRRGLMAGGGGLVRLPKRIPPSVAMEWALVGEPVDAGEAYRVGLVNRVVDDGAALSCALELGGKIAANGPLAVAASKQVMTESAESTLAEAFDRQLGIVDQVLNSADAKEGATAFVEHRAARWQAR
jgi:enoyl-CoA hydratase